MIKIIGINIPSNKNIYIALTYIYGIGLFLSKKILNRLDISLYKKSSTLIQEEIIKIQNLLESNEFKVEGKLKKFVTQNIKNLVDINSYKGRRHIKNLPVRGQRTRTNAKNSKKKF